MKSYEPFCCDKRVKEFPYLFKHARKEILKNKYFKYDEVSHTIIENVRKGTPAMWRLADPIHTYFANMKHKNPYECCYKENKNCICRELKDTKFCFNKR